MSKIKKKKVSKSSNKKSKKKSSKKALSPQKGTKNFSDLLTHKREEILQTVKQKEMDVSSGEIGDEADVASQTFEREMMYEMTNAERMILDDIEAALRKIERNEFGTCESCKKKISNQRLRAMPWARYCIGCQSKAESPRA